MLAQLIFMGLSLIKHTLRRMTFKVISDCHFFGLKIFVCHLTFYTMHAFYQQLITRLLKMRRFFDSHFPCRPAFPNKNSK